MGAVGACARQQLPLLPVEPPGLSPRGPDSFLVAFETTKGPFTMLARRHWSPFAADRFHDLVQRGFYDGVTVYRVVEGFVAQFGYTDSAAVNAAWRARPIPDEPVRAENTRGRVAFARSGPGSRDFQLFVNLGDNSPRLDTLTVQGVTGYPPFAEVLSGMETVERLDARWGGEPSAQQDSIFLQGGRYLQRAFPGLDRVVSARVTRVWR